MGYEKLDVGFVFYSINFKEYKHHVIHTFTIDDELMVVHRRWLKKRQRWEYKVEFLWEINIGFKYENYYLKKVILEDGK